MGHSIARVSLMTPFVVLPIIFSAGAAYAQSAEPPAWAYPVNPPDFKPSPDDGKPRRVPDSNVEYTVPQTRDPFLAPDWHRDSHPSMPPIVAQGRRPDVYACGFCHRAEGTGGPENADLAGLPTAYFIQQMQDYKSGKRSTALPKRIPQNWMISLAKAATDDEIKAAADYFAAIKPMKLTQVIETDTVPVTRVAGWFLADSKTGAREPIGQRIIEMPEDVDRFLNRDTRARFIAYVPTGSVARGKAIAAGGDTPCAACHGEKLTGTDAIPGIAGRSPSYIFRQLYEYRHGFRAGSEGDAMIEIVKKLDEADFLPLAAYLASLER